MRKVKEGDMVQILCEGRLADGRIFYKNDEKNPIKLVVGEGTIFPALEQEILDMKSGESKTVTLDPSEAFGEHQHELVVVTSKERFNPDLKLALGHKVSIDLTAGKKLIGTIIEIDDEIITIDFNHPLAGQTVVFTVTVVSIEGN